MILPKAPAMLGLSLYWGGYVYVLTPPTPNQPTNQTTK